MVRKRSPWPQWPLLAVLLLGVIAVAAVWFTIVRSSGPEEENEEPQRYVEAIVGTPARINPFFAYLNDVDRDLATLVFAGLTRLGPTGEVLPDLALSWQISPDGLTYTFHLRAGITWHTGTSFSSEDVLFTYGLLAGPALRADPALGALWRQVSCQAPDQLTVVCRLPEPFAPFLSFTTIGILPKHVLEGADPAMLIDHPFNQAPVGTGPYRLAQLDQTKAVLKANTRYHFGEPTIDEIDLLFFPDSAAAAAALHLGQVQGLLLGPSANPEDADTLRADGRLRAYTGNRTAYTLIYLNNTRPPFDDKRVRQALAHAVDIDEIIGNLLEGRAVRADSPIIPGTWASSPELQAYPHDPNEAQRLLDEAGWLKGENGRQKEGVELRITLMTDHDPLRAAIAERIGVQLEKVGVNVTVASLGATELVRDLLIPRQYQAAIFGWDPGADPDPYPAWHSSQTGEQGRNLAGYFSEAADKALEEARKTTDLERRRALYLEFQQTFHDDIPSLLLYYPVFTYFVREEVTGVELGTLFDTGSRFASVRQWRVEEDSEFINP